MLELRMLSNKGTRFPPWQTTMAQASGGQPRERTSQPASLKILTMVELKALDSKGPH